MCFAWLGKLWFVTGPQRSATFLVASAAVCGTRSQAREQRQHEEGVLGRGAPWSRALLAGLLPDSWGWRGKHSSVPSCPGPCQPDGSCSRGSGA